MMTVGTSLKQLFQLCSGKYLKSEPSKFKAVNKVCLCWLCQADLTEKIGGGGRGDRASRKLKSGAALETGRALLAQRTSGGRGGGRRHRRAGSKSYLPAAWMERERAVRLDSLAATLRLLASVLCYCDLS